MRRHTFNMIEITLAMLVISIGIVSIFGLIPIGYKAHRDAIYMNHSADAAEEVLHRLSYQLQKDWATVEGSLIEIPPDISTVDATNWTLVDGYLYKHDTIDGVYRIFNNKTLPSGRNVTDFDGVIRIWKKPTTAFEYDGTNFQPKEDTAYAKRIRLNAEVCWPLGTDYELQSRAFYSMEVIREQP